MRTSSPCVALPFDPGRVRPELVGFLLHPVSRSETWRRLGTQRPSSEVRQAFIPRTRRKAPGAEPKNCRRIHLADVPQTTGAGRFGGNRTPKNYLLILRELTDFLNGKSWTRRI